MAKKEKELLSDLDLDLELDFGNGEDNFGVIADKEVHSDKRKPVISAIKGIKKGATDAATDPRKIGTFVKRSLPKNYGEFYDNSSMVVGTTANLYNEAVREVKPAAKQTVKQINKLVPEELKRSKSFMNKLEKFFGDDERVDDNKNYREDQVSSDLKKIFEVDMEQRTQERAEDKSESRILANINMRQNRDQVSLLNSINIGVSHLSNYNKNINANYQRKSLELQYRTLFALTDTLELQKKYFEIFKNQNDAVSKNTALPEYVKLKNSERMKEMMRTKFAGSMYDGLFANNKFIANGMKNIKSAVSQKIQSAKNTFQDAAFGLEQVNDARAMSKEMASITGEESFNPAEMTGELAGGGIVDHLAGKLGKKIRGKLDNNNTKIGRFGQKLSKYGGINAGSINALRNAKFMEDEWEPGIGTKVRNGGRGFLNFFLDQFSSQPDMNLKQKQGLGGLSDHAVYGGKEQKAIHTVIPGYLARILREIQVLRTGDESIGITNFNHLSGKFDTSSKLGADIKKFIKAGTNKDTVDYRTNKTVGYITDGTNMSGKATDALKGKLKDTAFKDNILDAEYMKSDNFLSGLDPDVKLEILAVLNKKFDKSSNDYNEKDAGLAQHGRGIKGAIGDVRGLIEQLDEAGYTEELRAMGYLEEGSDKISKTKLRELLDDEKKPGKSPNMEFRGRKLNPRKATSDINAKTKVKPLDSIKALGNVLKTKVFGWKYKPNQGDGDSHIGPMAQDVKSVSGTDMSSDGKSIDLVSLNGQNMAAIQGLYEQLDKSSLTSLETLKLIQADTHAILGKMGSGTGSNVIGKDDYYTGKSEAGKVLQALITIGGVGIKTGASLATKSVETLGKATKGMLSAGGKALEMRKNLGSTILGNKTLQDLAKNMADKTVKFGADLLNRGHKLATDLTTKFIPNSIKGIKNFTNNVKDKVIDYLNTPVDIYVPGINSPVLLAVMMKTGGYFDKATGNVIKTLADIKGEVVDKDGNVVLSLDMIKKGIRDKYGEPIKAFGKGWIENIVKLTGTGIKLGHKLLSSAKDKFSEMFEDGKNIGKNLLGKLGSIFKLPLGGKFTKMSYDVLVQIRDILDERLPGGNGEGGGKPKFNDKDGDGIRDGSAETIDPNKPKNDKEPEKADSDPRYKSSGNVIDKLAGIGSSLWGNKDKLLSKIPGKDKAGKLLGKIPGAGRMSKALSWAGGLFGKGKDTSEDSEKKEESKNTEEKPKKSLLSKLKNSVKGSLMGKLPMMTTMAKGKKAFNDRDGDGKREGSWESEKDALAEKEKARKEALASQETVSKDARYKSDKNVIDIMIEKAKQAAGMVSGLFGKGKDLAETAIEAKAAKDLLKGGKAAGVAKKPGLLRRMAGGIGRGILGGAKMLGSGYWNTTSKLGNVLGKGVSAVGNGMVKGAGFLANNAGAVANSAANLGKGALNVGKMGLKAIPFLAAGADVYSGVKDLMADPNQEKGTFNSGLDYLNPFKYGAYAGKYINKGLNAASEAVTGGKEKTLGGALYSLFNKDPDINAEPSLASINSYYKSKGIEFKSMDEYKAYIEKKKQERLVDPTAKTSQVAAGVAMKVQADKGPNKTQDQGGIIQPKSQSVTGGSNVNTTGGNSSNITAFEAVRFKSYGMCKPEPRFVSALRHIETFLAKRVMIDGGNNAKLEVDFDEIISNVGIDFGVSDTEDKNADRFRNWYTKRFMPVYLNFHALLNKATGKNEIASAETTLTPNQQFDIAGKLSSTSGIWSSSYPIWDGVEPNKDKDSVKENLNWLENKVKEEKVKEQQAPKVNAEQQNQGQKPQTTQSPTTVVDNKQQQNNGSVVGGSSNANPAANPNAEQQPSVTGSSSTGDAPSSNLSLGNIKVAGGPLSSGDNGSQFISKNDSGVDTSGVNPTLWKLFNGMAEEYGNLTGKKLLVTSAYRSSAKQQALYAQNPAKAAKPGRSPHEFGLALDVNSPDLDALDKMGLLKKYGFTRPIGGETWHIEPSGLQGSADIRAKAKQDSGYAAQQILASIGRGGGGIGSIKGSKLGSRDDKLAAELAKADGVVVENLPKDAGGVNKPNNTALAEGKKQAILKPAGGNNTPMKATADTGSSGVSTPATMSPSNETTVTGSGAGGAQTASGGGGWKPPESMNVGGGGYGGSVQNTAQSSNVKQPENKQEVLKVINSAAQKTGIDPKVMQTIAATESGLRPGIQAKGSSAGGLFQFIDSTWNSMLDKFGPKYHIQQGTPKSDANANSLMGGEYIKMNMNALKSVKPNPDAVDIYLAHFLGTGGARKLLKSDPNAIAAEVFPKAASANRSIFYNLNGQPRTIQELRQLMQTKLTKAANGYGIQPPNMTAGIGTGTGTTTTTTTGSTPAAQSTMSTKDFSAGKTGGGSKGTSFSNVSQPTPQRSAFSSMQQGGGFSLPGTGQSNSTTEQSPGMQLPGADQMLNSVNDTLKQSLDIQSRMLTALESMAKNMGNFTPSENNSNASQSETGSQLPKEEPQVAKADSSPRYAGRSQTSPLKNLPISLARGIL